MWWFDYSTWGIEFAHHRAGGFSAVSRSFKPQYVTGDKESKRRWSYFIRKVYETDPLVCPKCRGEMRTISFIGQPEVIIHTKRI